MTTTVCGALWPLPYSTGTSYRVLQARNGKEALEVARQEKPALVFLDVKMPLVDGFEVCRQLKADPQTSTIPVYLLSAMSQAEDKERGRLAGADGYFTKPFSPLALLEKVDEVTGL